MSPLHSLSTGLGAGKRRSYVPPIPAANFPVQASRAAASIQLPHYPFQPLPTPNGAPPYRFDLSQLLPAADIAKIKSAGVMVFHAVGDTGDYRDSGPQDLVATIMTQDAQNSPEGRQPAFHYHLGDASSWPFLATMIASLTILRTGPWTRTRFRSTVGCRISCRKIPLSWVR